MIWCNMVYGAFIFSPKTRFRYTKNVTVLGLQSTQTKDRRFFSVFGENIMPLLTITLSYQANAPHGVL